MKHTLILLATLFATQQLTVIQAQNSPPVGIQWMGEDETANDLVLRGIRHLLNIEREKAFTYFDAAVQKDPTLFAPHVFLSWMSRGDTRAYHKVQAQKLVRDKNEASKLYVSLLETGSGTEGAEKRRSIWKKMHELAPEGPFIHYNYARSLQDPKAQIMELEKLMANNEKNERGSDYVHNLLGYIYYAEGDKVKSKMHLEKYLDLRPDGYNAYDSMAEFYQNEGDLENALVYYKKAKEKYPAAMNATNRIEKIEAELGAEGNLWLITTEYVDPQHFKDYIQWGKEYKEIADDTNYKTFLVSSKNNVYNYAHNIGKTMSDMDAFNKERKEWHEDHPEVRTQYEKYKQTITNTKRSLWRHNPNLSYQAEGASASDENTYVRSYRAYVKFGHEAAIKDLLKEFKEIWESKKISTSYGVYWNVFGEDGPCVSIRTGYKDIAAWQADREEVNDKVGESILNDLGSRWNGHIRKGDTQEVFPRPELSHRNTDALTSN